MSLENLLKKLEDVKKNPDLFQSADEYNDLAMEFFNAGREDLHVETLEEARIREQTNAEVFHNLGVYYYESRNLKEAINVLEEARRKKQTNANIFLNLGCFYTESGNPEKAASIWEEARRKKQTNARVFCNLGAYYDESGKPEKAASILEEALRKKQTDAGIFHKLGNLYYEDGNQEKAISTLEKAIRRKQVTPEIFFNLGIYYHESGNPEKAISTLEKAIRENQTDASIFDCLGYYYQESEDREKAIEIYKKGIKKYSAPDLFSSLGYCLFWNGRGVDKKSRRKAVALLEKAVEQGHTSTRVFNLLSAFYCLSKRKREAATILRKAIKEGQADSDTFERLFRLKGYHPHMGRIKEIIDKEDNKDYRAYIHLANYAKKHGPLDGKASTDFIKLMIAQMKKNGEFKDMLEEHAKATNKIRVLQGGSVLSNAVIIKEGDSCFDKEREIRDRLETIVGRSALLPTYVDHFEYQGKFYYIMERALGETLTDSMKWVPKGTYDRILKLLAKMHVLMPAEELKDYDFAKKSKEKILKAEFDRSLADSIKPVLDVLANSSYWAYNKDSCTDNWMILRGKDKILICDTEDRGRIPYAVDLAHFLNFIPAEPFKKRMSRVKTYTDYVNRLCEKYSLPGKKITDIDRFTLEYCNGVVYRSIANCGYLFSKERPAHSKQVTQTGVEMIDYMQQNGMIKPEDKYHYQAIRQELLKRYGA